MNDLISRQAAIDALDGELTITGRENAKTIRDYIKGVDKKLRELPSAERWIPVTERLPENTDPVNITWVNRKPSGYYKHIKDKPFMATGHYCNGRWYWFSAVCQDYLNEYGDCEMDRIDPAVEIVAWQPLPSPYKGGKE